MNPPASAPTRVALTRTVRMNINPAPPDGRADTDDPDLNGTGGKPAMRGLGRHYRLDVRCRGEPDARSGYLVNIKTIDAAVRRAAGPMLAEACEHRPHTDPATLVGPLTKAVAAELMPVRLVGLCWWLSPTYSVAAELPEAGETAMNPFETQPDEATAPTGHPEPGPRVVLRQRFDFAAAHRLHVPEWDDETNRRVFGKCNNPSGHGHNYGLEPAVALGPAAVGRFTVADLERLTDETLLARFDHTHLNLDTEEFSAESGDNPSVENIARACFGLLAPAVARAHADASLAAVTVWETDRTSATYPA